MSSPMDLDICSSPFKDDEDDIRSSSMSISSYGDGITCFRDTEAPFQLSDNEQMIHRSLVPPAMKHDTAFHLTATYLSEENIRDKNNTEFTQSQATTHYQTRWTYICNHMLIHDDEDPLYPIRVGPRQLHKTSTESCPMCKEQAEAAEEMRKKKTLEEVEMVRDLPIHGIIKEDILAESVNRRDSLRLAVLGAQRDQVLKYAQFLDSNSEPSVQAWDWYDGCNREWEAKMCEVEKRNATAANSRGPSISMPVVIRSSWNLMDGTEPSMMI